jgi:hypothetical protein
MSHAKYVRCLQFGTTNFLYILYGSITVLKKMKKRPNKVKNIKRRPEIYTHGPNF